MKLKFDPNQQYQIDAIDSVVNIFKGQPLNKSDFEVHMALPEERLQIGGVFAVGNQLVLCDDDILKNVQAIQANNKLDATEQLDGKNFSVEMETGTGKSYIYLRTIHELHKRFGFKKFVIVVPSIAIKEGAIKNLQVTKEHFDVLYENPEMDFYVYDPKKRGQIKNFATANTLQILVINIDSFAKESKEKGRGNIIYQNSDWGVPIEYINAVNPIVIVDEPQNMETDIRRRAIQNLNPLCTLRYSATHRNLYNLMYKLDPVKAYDLGLVKKIEVDSVLTDEDFNNAFVELESVHSQKTKVTAKIKIDVLQVGGVKRKIVTAKYGNDLFELSGKKDIYREGYIIDGIDVANQSVTFSNGTSMSVGESQGSVREEIMKYQIMRTVQNHFEKEKKMQGTGIKVLSLFFIDRVANYREYTDSGVTKGKLALWFEEAYKQIANNSTFKGLLPYTVEEVHNGYFSQDKKGVFKDTGGDTQADDETYNLIMKDKEKLLDTNTPLRFIFSHSALREGWDNPNVFQICTLNETTSELKKRQEIGRGLRLPVNQDGERVFDENINILTVISNESYEDFAKKLQNEIHEECGVDFSGRIKAKAKRKSVKLNKKMLLDVNFKALWDKIKHRTKYSVDYDTDELIAKAGKELENVKISAPRLRNERGRLDITSEGISGRLLNTQGRELRATSENIPDVLGYVQGKTNLTKDTISQIVIKANKIEDIMKNPQQFMDVASKEINRVLSQMMIDGIKYEKIAGEVWEMKEFESAELEGYLDSMYKVQEQDKTLYDYIIVDSNIESEFAKDLESRQDVKFYIKLPNWFKIETPVGGYNPDWAIMFEKEGQKKLYFVVETKGTNDINSPSLAESERLKIRCGKKHFEQFPDVQFVGPIDKANKIPA